MMMMLLLLLRLLLTVENKFIKTIYEYVVYIWCVPVECELPLRLSVHHFVNKVLSKNQQTSTEYEWMRAHFLYWSLVYRRQHFHLRVFSHRLSARLSVWARFFRWCLISHLLLFFGLWPGMRGKMKLFTSPSAFSFWMGFLFAWTSTINNPPPKKKERLVQAVSCDYHNVNIFWPYSYMPSIDNDAHTVNG